MLIPAFRAASVTLDTVVSSGGVSATHHGETSGFAKASTDADDVLNSSTINAVAVVTQHNTHARFVEQALQAGKHVFVEKPLAMSHDELASIDLAYQTQQSEAASGAAPMLMVGFNRRFAPQVVKMKSLMSAVNTPKSLIMTVNAGAIEAR